MKLKQKTIENDLEYLRQRSMEVDFDKDDWKTALNILDNYCKEEKLVLAMASVQLGIPLRMIYLKKTDLTKFDDDNYNESKILINPVIVSSRGLTRYYEACASCLDYVALVERPYEIDVEYLDEEENRHVETFTGFSATVISHEVDHLDGVLHMDRAIELYKMTPEERKEFRKSHPYEIINKNAKHQYKELKKIL